MGTFSTNNFLGCVMEAKPSKEPFFLLSFCSPFIQNRINYFEFWSFEIFWDLLISFEIRLKWKRMTVLVNYQLSWMSLHFTARQNGFEYKVKTQANDYQNLKVDTLRVQNNRKLKSYTVEFFSGKFLTAPTGIWTPDP